MLVKIDGLELIGIVFDGCWCWFCKLCADNGPCETVFQANLLGRDHLIYEHECTLLAV